MKGYIINIIFFIKEVTRKAGTTRIILILLAILTAGYLAACLIAPGHSISQFNHKYGFPSAAETGKEVVVPEYPQLSVLVRKKAYLESRIAMAGADSIGLVVNLRDSLVALEINGIMIHKGKIKDYKVDKFFFALDNKAYAALFSQPLIIGKHHGTIVKEPIFVQKAPKDTIEAADLVFTPDTIHRIPEYITFSLSYGIRLCFDQNEKGRFRKFTFNTVIRSRQTWKNITAILRFKVPEYEPCIRITLPGKDITSIYRALPEKARVAVLI